MKAEDIKTDAQARVEAARTWTGCIFLTVIIFIFTQAFCECLINIDHCDCGYSENKSKN